MELRIALRNYLRGIGRVLDIAPRNDYSKLVPTYSPQEALAMDFARTGDDIRSSMSHFDQEIASQTRTRQGK